jgi:hypothetical protein
VESTRGSSDPLAEVVAELRAVIAELRTERDELRLEVKALRREAAGVADLGARRKARS